MAVYLGSYGRVELTRRGGSAEFSTTINPGDINANRRRFSFDDSDTRLITGDEVMITSQDDTNLDFIAATGWGNNTIQTSWSGWVHVDDMGGIRLYRSFSDSLVGNLAAAVGLVAINRDIPVRINPASSNIRFLGQVTDYELNTNVETADSSGLGDEFRSSVDTIKSGSGSLTAFWDYRDLDGNRSEVPYYLQQLAVRTEIGQEFTARLYLKARNITESGANSLDDEIWYDITAVITSSAVQFNTGDPVRLVAEFVTTGPIRLLARTETADILDLDGSDENLELEDGSGNVLLEDPESGTVTPPTPFLITLSSSSITTTIGTAFKVAQCGGTNTSPALSWSTSGTPSAAVSTWRLRCYDRAGNGTETAAEGNFWAGSFIHWKVNGIPSATTSIAQNGSWPGGVTVIDNDWINFGNSGTDYQRANGWGGPCPDGHTYEFFVTAHAADGTLVGRSNTLAVTSITA